ncbi:hypothetical protein [Pandoraea sputorum]|uniref:Uncharacterized protein n=1 Tax=Pandoraea sputorum TaxID=93222 RepID=A0A5E5BKR3_9BURK|nr:hypothetical protein [Pandoraea sputorum]VVE85856.1 hypothetical protein PSP31121_05489 [Pandoraea sputorum]
MRNRAFVDRQLYPNYQTRAKPELCTNPLDGKASCSGQGVLRSEEERHYDAGIATCQEIKKIIEDKVRCDDFFAGEENNLLSSYINKFTISLQVLKCGEHNPKAMALRGELLTEFGSIIKLVLDAPDTVRSSMKVTCLQVFVDCIFELGNRNNNYELKKIIKIVDNLIDKISNDNLKYDLRKSISIQTTKYGISERETIEDYINSVHEKTKIYQTAVYRQYPDAEMSDVDVLENFSIPWFSEKIASADDAAYFSRLVKKEIVESDYFKRSDEIIEKFFQKEVIPLAKNSVRRAKCFEMTRGSFNTSCRIWTHALSRRFHGGELSEKLADDMKDVIYVMADYCDYYIQEMQWFNGSEVLVAKAGAAYLTRLNEFAAQNRRILARINGESIEENEPIDFGINKDALLAMLEGNSRREVNDVWEEYLPSKKNDLPDLSLTAAPTFVAIELISPENLYSLEILVLAFTNNIIEQAVQKNIDLTPSIQYESLSDEGDDISQEISEMATTKWEEPRRPRTPEPVETTPSIAALAKETSHANIEIFKGAPENPVKIENTNIKQPKSVKNRILQQSDAMISIKDARKLLHPNAFSGDLREISFPGGALYLTKENTSIGRLWQTEDRLKSIISYTKTKDPKDYAFFPQEILSELSKKITESEYKDLMLDIQANSCLRSRHKVQGIIKIKDNEKDKDRYQMRIVGGDKSYRLVFKLFTTHNRNSLFIRETRIYMMTDVFFHHGKTNKITAQLSDHKVSELTERLSSAALHIAPTASLSEELLH